MKDKMQIAEELKTLRGDRPKEEVALACGVTVSAITMYEAGARMPRDTVKIALADYFGKSVGDLFFGE